MMKTMRRGLLRRRFLSVVLVLLLLGAAPMSAMADDSKPDTYDGRLDDYNRQVTLQGGSTALTYFIWVGLGVAAVIVMFKDAKRTHLD
jgi:hypothetical protein